jgi:hypothetical protein
MHKQRRSTSTNRRALLIANSCQVFEPWETPQSPVPEGFAELHVENRSTPFQEDPLFYVAELKAVMPAAQHQSRRPLAGKEDESNAA